MRNWNLFLCRTGVNTSILQETRGKSLGFGGKKPGNYCHASSPDPTDWPNRVSEDGINKGHIFIWFSQLKSEHEKKQYVVLNIVVSFVWKLHFSSVNQDQSFQRGRKNMNHCSEGRGGVFKELLSVDFFCSCKFNRVDLLPGVPINPLGYRKLLVAWGN